LREPKDSQRQPKNWFSARKTGSKEPPTLCWTRTILLPRHAYVGGWGGFRCVLNIFSDHRKARRNICRNTMELGATVSIFFLLNIISKEENSHNIQGLDNETETPGFTTQ